MPNTISPANASHQGGAALLVFMLFFFLGAMAWLLTRSGSAITRQQIDHATTAALAEAKSGLIGRAAQDGNRPGSLTCPDTDNDGIANQVAGNCTAYIGRLPWKTLDLADLRDGRGERLWYALDPGLRDNPAAEPINPQKALQLSLDTNGAVAALVFSAGSPLSNQNGRPSNTVSDYLDGSNSDGDTSYVSGPSSPLFNDVVLAITRDDVFRTTNQRVLGEIRGPDDNAPGAPNHGLRRYHEDNGTFPWADTDNDGSGNPGANSGNLPFNDLNLHPTVSAWLNANAWLPLITYQRISANAATIAIGTSAMNISPCPSSPCP